MSASESNVVAVIEGPVEKWTLDPAGKKVREYVVTTLPFGVAARAFKPDPFKPTSGAGEQRDIVPGHVRKLRSEMENHTYTPTAIQVGLRPKHAKNLVREDGRVTLEVEDGKPLPQTDGSHRFGAMLSIRKDAEKAGDAGLMALVDALPVTAMVMLNGDTQVDFLNLQQGRPVDASHMLSLKIAADMFDGPRGAEMKKAFEVAKALNASDKSPFHKLVRMDSKAQSGQLSARLPVSTLLASGSSDISTSLVGLVRVGGDAAVLAQCVTDVYQSLKEKAPELLEEGMPLTDPKEGGTKGSATMLVGLGVCVAYRMKSFGGEAVEPADVTRAVACAKKVLCRPTEGNFSGAMKRELMGSFAAEYFEDLDGDKHAEIPVLLLKALSCSSFGVEPLPRGGQAA